MMPLLPVLAAGLVPFIVGSVWYHPSVFGAAWMQLKHITPEKAERASRLAFHSTGVMLVLGIFSAIMLFRIFVALEIDTAWHGVLSAIGIWLGFVVPTTIHRVLWDHIPLRLYAIETGQWFISFCLMGAVLTI